MTEVLLRDLNRHPGGDNQTVYSMLVPIIQRAKARRQIVLVTHNANLAVCCDAAQIDELLPHRWESDTLS